MVQRRYANRPTDTETTNYLLREVPLRIWTPAKERAHREHLDMRAVILTLVEQYVKKGLPK